MQEVLIVGAGVGGLTLALSLHQAGISCRIFEAAPELKPLGVGINLLPHAMRELTELGLKEQLEAVAIPTEELAFYNRHGQFIFREPRGLRAGYDWPQLSIHRGDLQMVLVAAVEERIGADRIHAGHRCTAIAQEAESVVVSFQDPVTGAPLPDRRGAVAVGCDGIHSTVRKQLYPDEGPPVYSGINMWRGAAWWPPFLTGASMALIGSLRTGKLVVYPIRRRRQEDGRQLVNWVAEIESETWEARDWNRKGRREDFFWAFEGFRFDWLDAAGLIEHTETVLEYPMVDQDPLQRWSFGRVTLLGDAAHPMYPRGSNGAGQAILDARCLAGHLKRNNSAEEALRGYDAERAPAVGKIVLMNRTNPPDAILREVDLRTGGARFERIEDVISRDEMVTISEQYKKVAGFDVENLRRRPSFV